MCEFCVQHGEGKIWYLQAKNYVEELLNEERKRYMAEFWEKMEENVAGGDAFSMLDRLIAADPAAAKALIISGEEASKQAHWGQVIPIEDVEKVLDTTVSVVRVPCVCRSVLSGVYDARFCFCFTTFKSDFWPRGMFDQYPDYGSNLEELTREEAIKEFQKYDRNGLMHSIWTHGTPFISAICNCTPRDCMTLRIWQKTGTRPMFKAEYVATIDVEECNGCRDCMKVCHFGAISYSVTLKKCFIDQWKCFGCGLCRAVCSQDAAVLQDRKAIPMLAKEW